MDWVNPHLPAPRPPGCRMGDIIVRVSEGDGPASQVRCKAGRFVVQWYPITNPFFYTSNKVIEKTTMHKTTIANKERIPRHEKIASNKQMRATK